MFQPFALLSHRRRVAGRPVFAVTASVRHAAVAALLLLTALVYAPSLDHPFQYDDGHTIVDNAALRQPGAWKAAFSGTTLSSAETSGGHYRPLTYLSYWATIRAAGVTPTAFHAGNLALHLAAVWLLIGVVTRLTGDGRVGFVAGAIAALHPANSETVFYASARAGLLAVVLSLAALWCFARARERQAAGRSAFGASTAFVALTLLALLAKETAAALPLMGLAADRWLLPARARVSAWRRWGPYAPLAGGFALYAAATGLWRPAAAAVETAGEVGRYLGVVAQQLEAIGLGVRLFLVPWPLSVEHPLPAWPDAGAVFLWGLVLSLVGFAAAAARSTSPSLKGAGFFAAWALIVTLPTVLWPLNVPFQEHRAYFQHAGLAALAALVAVRAIDARPAWRRPAIAAGIVVMVLFSWLVVERGHAWSDPVRLWDDARSHTPRSFRAQTNAGLALASAGRWTDADRAFAAALALHPDYPPALVGHGVAAHHRGNRDAARARYQRAVDVAPGYVPAWYNLGLVAQESGDAAEAERAYRRALAINPLHAPSLLNVGVLFLLQSRWAEADAALKIADAASPESPDVFYHRGLLAELTGSPVAARALYATAERLALAAGRAPIAASARARLTALP